MEIWEVWHPMATALLIRCGEDLSKKRWWNSKKGVEQLWVQYGTVQELRIYEPLVLETDGNHWGYVWSSHGKEWNNVNHLTLSRASFYWQRLRDKNLGRTCCIGSNMLNIISVNDSHSVWLLMHWHTLLGAKLRQSEMEMLWVRDSNRFLDSHLFLVAMGLMKILRRQSCQGLGIKDKDGLQPWYMCI